MLENSVGSTWGYFDLRGVTLTGGIEEITVNDGSTGSKYLILSSRQFDGADGLAPDLVFDGIRGRGQPIVTLRIDIDDAFNSGNVDISGWSFRYWDPYASLLGDRISILGTDSSNTIRGGSQPDRISGGDGDDFVYGNGGADNLSSFGGDNQLYGGDGNDLLNSGEGNDYLYGGAGNDKLYNEGGVSYLYGGEGNDYLSGDGVTFSYGGAGNDELRGENMHGGDGNDSYLVLRTSNFISEGAGRGIDTVESRLDTYALPENVENLTLSNNYGTNIGYGNDLNNVMTGNLRGSEIYGLGGDDFIYGGVGKPSDRRTGPDQLYGGDGNDAIFAGRGTDTVWGDAGDDRVGGGSGNDIVYGGDGNDILTGDNNSDVLYGGDGDDMLDGGSVRDTMYGGAGDDLIFGGVGIDRLDGGAGDDLFIYNDVAWSSPTREDRIVGGFDKAGNGMGDRFDLSGIDADTTIGGNQTLTFGGSQGVGVLDTSTGHFWFANEGTNTLLRANNDGDASVDFEVVIVDGGVLASAYNGFDVMV